MSGDEPAVVEWATVLYVKDNRMENVPLYFFETKNHDKLTIGKIYNVFWSNQGPDDTPSLALERQKRLLYVDKIKRCLGAKEDYLTGWYRATLLKLGKTQEELNQSRTRIPANRRLTRDNSDLIDHEVDDPLPPAPSMKPGENSSSVRPARGKRSKNAKFSNADDHNISTLSSAVENFQAADQTSPSKVAENVIESVEHVQVSALDDTAKPIAKRRRLLSESSLSNGDFSAGSMDGDDVPYVAFKDLEAKCSNLEKKCDELEKKVQVQVITIKLAQTATNEAKEKLEEMQARCIRSEEAMDALKKRNEELYELNKSWQKEHLKSKAHSHGSSSSASKTRHSSQSRHSSSSHRSSEKLDDSFKNQESDPDIHSPLSKCIEKQAKLEVLLNSPSASRLDVVTDTFHFSPSSPYKKDVEGSTGIYQSEEIFDCGLSLSPEGKNTKKDAVMTSKTASSHSSTKSSKTQDSTVKRFSEHQLDLLMSTKPGSDGDAKFIKSAMDLLWSPTELCERYAQGGKKVSASDNPNRKECTPMKKDYLRELLMRRMEKEGASGNERVDRLKRLNTIMVSKICTVRRDHKSSAS